MRIPLPAAAPFAAGLVAVLWYGAAAAASAQGSFYREVVKDERVYVFNDMHAFQAFEGGGEVAGAITLPGYGPNGETMVFDSEEAIHLFNFKHGRPGDPRPRPTPPPLTRVTWRDGATTILFPDRAQVKISNRIQVRFSQELPDDAVTLPGTEGPGDSRGSFRIRRGKFKIDGWLYKAYLLYELQVNWPAVATSGNPGALLEDASLNWDLTRGDKKLMVKFGQYKVPFGQQELTSSGSQQLVDRSAVSNEYARGRDAGLQLWGVLARDLIEWRVGAFNGNGLTRSANDNDAFQYNARILVQPNRAVPLGNGLGNSGPLFSESDFESKDRPIWAVALNFEKNNFHRTTAGVDLADTVWGVDGLFKFKRLSLTAATYRREREPEPSAPGGAVTTFDSDGWFVQAGYLLDRARTWEVAGRYGRFDPSALAGGNDRTELRGGLNYYQNRHALKVQADFGQVEDRSNRRKNREFRLQTQFAF